MIIKANIRDIYKDLPEGRIRGFGYSYDKIDGLLVVSRDVVFALFDYHRFLLIILSYFHFSCVIFILFWMSTYELNISIIVKPYYTCL